MPKKWQGAGGKAAEARARKEAAKTAEKERIQKEIEDEYWRDDDKNLQRKQQRKDEREKKRQEQLERKRENNALLEQEMGVLKSHKAQPMPNKLTQFEIQHNRAKIDAEVAAAASEKEVPYDQRPVEENVNRMVVEGETARTVDEALNLLSVQPVDGIKIDYGTFEKNRLAELKAENPNLRLSQLKQLLKKEWLKSPDNPVNQRSLLGLSQ